MIGGGAGGCSILYWLAKLGWDDVVLVERADLTNGSIRSEAHPGVGPIRVVATQRTDP